MDIVIRLHKEPLTGKPFDKEHVTYCIMKEKDSINEARRNKVCEYLKKDFDNPVILVSDTRKGYQVLINEMENEIGFSEDDIRLKVTKYGGRWIEISLPCDKKVLKS
ncbi:hypothetical protein [Veillonella sp. R32]|uniref:hypothetical protein n=1 Tax=Veillonella sp. R32 TaxID=2021312 RepID=UPI00138A0889|nr:hypothetical protein [Veillonella sp. R32]KAF1678117.1 hypothetical protein VER_10050 [Veillonella sp. R32]